MAMQIESSEIQRVLDAVESLPVDDQMLVIDVVSRRLIQQRRAGLVAEVDEARVAYRAGEVRRGTVEDLLGDLDS